jgi:hypothetical protein
MLSCCFVRPARAFQPAILFLLVVLGSGGCAKTDADTVVDAGGGGKQCTPGQSFDVSGRTGVLATLNVHVDASGLVETDTTAELLLLLDLTQTGSDFTVNATVCDLKIPEVPISGQDQPLRFQLAPGLLDSVPDVSGAGVLDGDKTCSTFSLDPITVVIGAKMSPPAAGTLPEANADGMYTACLPSGSCATAITSNCACDQESDGNPGATLIAMNVPAVSISKVYVNLRTTFQLVGQVFSSDEIQGEVTASLEQGILGCAKLNGNDCSSSEVSAVKKLNPDIQQNSEPSLWRSVRVAEDLDCAALIEQKGELFPL